MFREMWKKLLEKIRKKFFKKKEVPKTRWFFRPIGNYQIGFPDFISEKMNRKSLMEDREKVYLNREEYVWVLEISEKQNEELSKKECFHLRFIIYRLDLGSKFLVEFRSQNR